MTNEEREALIAQGWTPPGAVDPDLAGGKRLSDDWFFGNYSYQTACLKALKRGCELAAADTKPGLVWVKYDGSGKCPVYADNYVWVKNRQRTSMGRAGSVTWSIVTHYAEITPPEGVA